MSANLNFIQRQNKPLNQTEEKTLNQKLSQIEKNALKEEIYKKISLNIEILQMLQTEQLFEKMNNFFDCNITINNNLGENSPSNIESENPIQNNDIFITLFPKFWEIQDGITNDKKMMPMMPLIIDMTDDLYKKLIEKLKLDPNQNRAKSYIALSKHLKLNDTIDQEIINTLNKQYSEIDTQINFDEETMILSSKKYGKSHDEIQSLLSNPFSYKLTFVLDKLETLKQKQEFTNV